ncbi:MAG: antibiotic hydrolase, partial [Acidobacteriota bacterium]|nr:antibiotic hydrolase [Acidobacteriota bacterium]
MRLAHPFARVRLVSLLSVSLAVAGGATPPTDAASEPTYDIVVMRDVMIPMRDGIELATDIYRPAKNGVLADGKFPVVMERTPYNKDNIAATADYF